MFGEDHWVWNLPRDARHKTSSMWLEKSKHVWVKTTVNLYFYEVAKTKHIPSTKEKNTHACKNPNMYVIFHTGGAPLCNCDCTWVFDI